MVHTHTHTHTHLYAYARVKNTHFVFCSLVPHTAWLIVNIRLWSLQLFMLTLWLDVTTRDICMARAHTHTHTHTYAHTLEHRFRLYYHVTACKIQRSAEFIWSQTSGNVLCSGTHTCRTNSSLPGAAEFESKESARVWEVGWRCCYCCRRRSSVGLTMPVGPPPLPTCPLSCCEEREEKVRWESRWQRRHHLLLISTVAGSSGSFEKPCEMPFKRKNRIWHRCSGLLEAPVGVREVSLCFSEGGFSAYKTCCVSIHSWYVGPALLGDTTVTN